MSFLIPFNIDNFNSVEKDNLKKSLASKNITNIAFDKINKKYQLVVTYANKETVKIPLDNFMPENIVTTEQFEELQQANKEQIKNITINKNYLVNLYRLVHKIVNILDNEKEDVSQQSKATIILLKDLVPSYEHLLNYDNNAPNLLAQGELKKYAKPGMTLQEIALESSTTKYLTKHGDTALDTLYRKNLSNMKGGTRYTIPILPMPQSNRQKLVTGIELVGKNLVVNYTDNSKTQIDLSNIVGSITAPSINTTAIQQIATGLLASLQTKFTELSRNLENKGSSELSNLKTNIAQIKQDIRDQLKTELSGTYITPEQLTALAARLQDNFTNEIKAIKVVKEIKVVN